MIVSKRARGATLITSQDESTHGMSPGDQVTAVVQRRIKPGREAEFEDWMHGLYKVASEFPGHQATTVIRPRDAQSREYLIVFGFDTELNLQHWEKSQEHTEWLAPVESLMQEPPTRLYHSGMETWFSVPGRPPVQPPPRWKMWTLAASVLYLLLLTFNWVFGSRLAPIAPGVRFLVTAPILSGVMTCVAMPWLSKRFARWLYPGR